MTSTREQRDSNGNLMTPAAIKDEARARTLWELEGQLEDSLRDPELSALRLYDPTTPQERVAVEKAQQKYTAITELLAEAKREHKEVTARIRYRIMWGGYTQEERDAKELEEAREVDQTKLAEMLVAGKAVQKEQPDLTLGEAIALVQTFTPEERERWANRGNPVNPETT